MRAFFYLSFVPVEEVVALGGAFQRVAAKDVTAVTLAYSMNRDGGAKTLL